MMSSNPGPQADTMPTNADLGQAIRRLRRDRDLTIEALAFDADMHPTYLSGIERGVRNPTWDKLTALAHALDTPMSALVRDAEVQAQLAARIREARHDLGIEPAAVIDLDEFEAARRDPQIHRMLVKAAAEGERIEREERKRW
jgi:transcriptional regulator with XRE-family HTH domain